MGQGRQADPHQSRERLDWLVAHEEIRQLAARYAVAVDSRDLDALVALFVSDVRVGRDRSGRAALRDDFDASLRTVGVTVLNVGTHAIDLVDADHATGRVYCKAEVQDGDRWVHQAVLYDDTYRREDGSWRFVRRHHQLFYGVEVTPNPMDLSPANWPADPDGKGTVPEAWDSWRAFWGDP
jgi:ketosteroid isomerase-like protein